MDLKAHLLISYPGYKYSISFHHVTVFTACKPLPNLSPKCFWDTITDETCQLLWSLLLGGSPFCKYISPRLELNFGAIL